MTVPRREWQLFNEEQASSHGRNKELKIRTTKAVPLVMEKVASASNLGGER